MSVSAPFSPMGNTVTFTANVAAPNAVQANSTTPGANNYEFVNLGNVVVHVGAGTSNATAVANALIPGANSAPSIPLAPGATLVWSFGPNFFFTGITSSGTAVVYVTPGDGA